MMLKGFGVLAPVVLGGMYVTGGFDGNYTRVVDRPQAEVMAALADLDIREQPGSPGTDPSRAGGVAPLFKTERGADSMTWWVMSGEKVATRMTASFEPLDGGRTRVTADVARGDAPDDFVSPAFRSEGITMGLFGMALEAELDELVVPPGGWNERCQQIMDGTLHNAHPDVRMRQQDLGAAIGSTATTMMRLSAMDKELKRNGCNTDRPAGGDLQPVVSRMGSDPGGSSGNGEGVSFEPGKPMIDVSR